ncbi:MAG: protein kinase, partial [Victivallales bacterium]|nr:protein kinase [Victivallales bacterium]
PEQVSKKPLDFHSDIYSLGVVLFYMLSGGKNCRHLDVSPHEIVLQAKNNYIDWGLLPKSLNKELLAILQQMLATNPEKRYSSAAEVARKLERYISRNGYSPTIVSLAQYIRREMPVLFKTKQTCSKKTTMNLNSSELDSEAEADRLGKTHLMSKEELTKSAVLKSRYI